MPVHDAPVHEKVRISRDEPYGCSNALRSHGYTVHERQYFGNSYILVERCIPDMMTKLCRHDARKTDPRCTECKRDSDVEWLRSYGLL